MAVLLAPLHVRPFTDDIWTIETQGDPRTGAGARRPTVVHDLIVSTLSGGPVGFADLMNHTNASLLAMATRADRVAEASEEQLREAATAKARLEALEAAIARLSDTALLLRTL